MKENNIQLNVAFRERLHRNRLSFLIASNDKRVFIPVLPPPEYSKTVLTSRTPRAQEILIESDGGKVIFQGRGPGNDQRTSCALSS